MNAARHEIAGLSNNSIACAEPYAVQHAVTYTNGELSLPTKSSLKSQVITQMIAIIGFVIVPILITSMAPFTDLTFRHGAAGATVMVKRYVLMFIPWRTTEIANVKMVRADINESFRYGNTAENRRKGRVGAVSHATGQLVITGEADEEIVQAAPEIAKVVSARFQQFLTNRAADAMTVPVYASWSLSYLLGGAVTALTALYVIGACLALIKSIYNFTQRRLSTGWNRNERV